MSSSAFTPSNNLAIPATTTQAGTVTTVAQTFAGDKTFNGLINASGGITIGGNETLSVYDEGTWVPTISGATLPGTGTYTTQAGHYTRIGRMVFVQCQITWTAHTGTGFMYISLPFVVNANLRYATNIIDYQSLTANGIPIIETQPGQSYGVLLLVPTAGGSVAQLPFDSAGAIFFSLAYMV